VSEVKVGLLSDIPDGGMQPLDIDGTCLVLCRSGNNLHVVEGVCPHRGAQLSQGQLEGTALVCPWHDWAFDVETGCGLTNPMSNLKTYEVMVRDGQIYVRMPDE
jgi:nitrite reductase/ring-hydroxylating ferredoxin subunit